MLNTTAEVNRVDGTIGRKWPELGVRRIPSWIYSDEENFRKELQTFHYGRSWNYIGLECEIPAAGSFKRGWIGPRSILATRDENGDVHVVENRCAHRDSQLTWQECGKFDGNLMVCPYHNWSYDLAGGLRSMPYYRGVNGNPGMPKEFDRGEHGLKKLRVATRGGTIWATYDEGTPEFADFIGPEILPWFDRVFNGKLKLLGVSRQIVPCNWKFYTDNTRDGYHAAFLHTFIPKFGLWRPDSDYHAIPTEGGRHILYHILYSPDLKDSRNESTKELRKMQSDYDLTDQRVISRYKDEFGDSSNCVFQICPTMLLQQFHSSLAVRHIIPKTATTHELSWNFFGYEYDDAEMVKARARHSNLVGPSGYISAEDTEMLASLQPVVNEHDTEHTIEMGGYGIEAGHTMITESPLRAFYDFYRREMKL
jgi:anthranilate 1,2-dioxygenase large subunit